MSGARHDTELREVTEAIEPADAFALLGNEHRLRILEVLAGLDEPIAFSDLYDAIELSDSAHFNYHLDQLTDHFVAHEDDGYRLREPGRKVVRAVLAGSINTAGERRIEMSDSCIACGSDLEARYADSKLEIICPACGHGHGRYSFPPGGFTDRTDDEVLAAFDQRVKHLHCLAKDGVCHECNGRVETRLVRDRECCLGTGVRAEHECTQCGYRSCSSVGLGVLDQSAVVAFHEAHGIDLATTPYWRHDWCVSDEPVTIRSEDPWAIAVDIEVEHEQLTVTVDGSLRVIGLERPSD